MSEKEQQAFLLRMFLFLVLNNRAALFSKHKPTKLDTWIRYFPSKLFCFSLIYILYSLLPLCESRFPHSFAMIPPTFNHLQLHFERTLIPARDDIFRTNESISILFSLCCFALLIFDFCFWSFFYLSVVVPCWGVNSLWQSIVKK